MQNLRRIDVFPKFDSRFESEARDRTVFGGVLSGFALFCILILVFSEAKYFFTTQLHHEMFVDGKKVIVEQAHAENSWRNSDERLQIYANITFFEVPCDLMSVDAIDAFGEFIQGIERATTKRTVSKATGKVSTNEAETLKLVGGAGSPDAKKNEKRPGCWSCYGAEPTPDSCCNTCDEVKSAYARKGWSFSTNDVSITQCAKERLKNALALQRHEGCNIVVNFEVSRVQGNLHFVPGRAFAHLGQHLHDLGGEEIKKLNLTHKINRLTFGEGFPGMNNPLDGAIGVSAAHQGHDDDFGLVKNEKQNNNNNNMNNKKEGEKDEQEDKTPPPFGGGKFQYFVKVVPTQYVDVAGYQINTNQYAVTSHYTSNTGNGKGDGAGGMQQQMITVIPGLFIQYDLSPIVARVTEKRPYASWIHFILQLSAITGGVFTVAGLVDAFIYHGSETLRRKIALGKQG